MTETSLYLMIPISPDRFLYLFFVYGLSSCFDVLINWSFYFQTGLSGSSAIVSATLSCLLDFYSVRHLIRIEVRPNLILNAEKELGIVAGLQDRVAQVYGGGLVHMVNSSSQLCLYNPYIPTFHLFPSCFNFLCSEGF